MPAYIERTAYFAEAPIALVIGCGGLGSSIARALGKRHKLLIVDVDAPRLEQVVAGLQYEGYLATGHTCDITDRAQTQALSAALANGPGIKALAHVAAVGMSVGDWRRMMEIDLFGAHLVAEAAGPHMVQGSAGVFISSLASYLPPLDPRLEAMLDDPLKPGFFEEFVAHLGHEPDYDWTYNYAKLGVNRLAERLAEAWGEQEARCLSLSPGMIDSPMARAEGPTLPSHDGTDARVSRSDKAREIPLGRQCSLLEVTAVADFILSDAASFLNGIDIPVDGGHRAVWRRRGIIQR